MDQITEYANTQSTERTRSTQHSQHSQHSHHSHRRRRTRSSASSQLPENTENTPSTPHAQSTQSSQVAKKAPKTRSAAPNQPSLLKDMRNLLIKIAAIAVCALLLFTFMFGLYRNTDASMSPTIKDGDLVMFYRLDKNYVARDTLVVAYRGQKQVRRVVAAAGDTVDFVEEGLIINGALQQESDIFSSTHRYDNGVEFPLVVPPGHVFVLGDSRTNASDSRVYGTLEIADTLGKVMTVLRQRNI